MASFGSVLAGQAFGSDCLRGDDNFPELGSREPKTRIAFAPAVRAPPTASPAPRRLERSSSDLSEEGRHAFLYAMQLSYSEERLRVLGKFQGVSLAQPSSQRSERSRRDESGGGIYETGSHTDGASFSVHDSLSAAGPSTAGVGAASVATSEYTVLSTDHLRQRCRERFITKRELQHAKKYGHFTRQSDGRWATTTGEDAAVGARDATKAQPPSSAARQKEKEEGKGGAGGVTLILDGERQRTGITCYPTRSEDRTVFAAIKHAGLPPAAAPPPAKGTAAFGTTVGYKGHANPPPSRNERKVESGATGARRRRRTTATTTTIENNGALDVGAGKWQAKAFSAGKGKAPSKKQQRKRPGGWGSIR